jgi:iron complex outermembrane receptor protein
MLEIRMNGVADTLEFSPLLALNFRAFTDMTRLYPGSAWTKGLRVSLNVTNLADQRQRVRDPAGGRPLQYQPAYRDPLGRTIELEIRKVF